MWILQIVGLVTLVISMVLFFSMMAPHKVTLPVLVSVSAFHIFFLGLDPYRGLWFEVGALIVVLLMTAFEVTHVLLELSHYKKKCKHLESLESIDRVRQVMRGTGS
ncbi:hypothetical protein A2837_01730 [Candidatus Kaiserbacteria bacterium RIFCSPHIGHO2_01_FULL_46_22]|uniref:Uncharacterized protein n=1 Tax=Candidatus Kaiserbacteria bacterium RIFCSPHIGHO2_01_FULL_46_22 TaxID=1798475 RepID=A0A1F6BYC2_9BACT|nr:MAG: hypothetical protein A2837_01730 [Candidatus Kaiserbacteria bacterium RIFCSPHIGHO2_01_FULL_46_22]